MLWQVEESNLQNESFLNGKILFDDADDAQSVGIYTSVYQ